MPRLTELQDAFADAIVNVEHDVPEAITSHSSPKPRERFNIYRNNVYSSLIDVLSARFPVAERLVGEEFFRAMARMFIEESPPRSPMLLVYGDAFPSFLTEFEHAQDVPYLPDIARLEWARHQAYHAADCAPLTAGELATVPPDQSARLVFEPHPSLALVRSPFPIVSIWQTNTADDEVKLVSLSDGGQNALIVRPQLEVETYKISGGEAGFVAALNEGANLASAAQAALEESADFALDKTLAQLLAIGALAGYQVSR